MSRVPALPILAAALALALATGGCVYRVNIPQGNYLEAKMLDQLQVGMTRSQVRYVLGTPMIADPFHPDQWDYLYYFKEGRTGKVETRLVVVYFAEEKVARIDRPPGEFKTPPVHNTVIL
ncbi:MAG: outer membrane protein assembly factor BamE [Proteobacteria bacterium]|nr:outer membrane protein assembly factor BamE [Pseudomonadota bacterium]